MSFNTMRSLNPEKSHCEYSWWKDCDRATFNQRLQQELPRLMRSSVSGATATDHMSSRQAFIQRKAAHPAAE